MADPYLLLWLEAPLQSWGHDSRFGRRDSLDFPTKSGVLGLIACAMGKADEQIEWLAKMVQGDMQAIAWVPQNKNGDAVSRLPLLRDFHMVGSGYDTQDLWQTLLIPKTSEGKNSVGGGSKITYRYYLQDMAFSVALQIPIDEVDAIVSALKSPVWDLYLGRKSCVPSEFIYQGLFDDLSAAHQFGNEIAEQKNKKFVFKVLEGEHDGEHVMLNDVPLQLGRQKKYRDRRVTVQSWE